MQDERSCLGSHFKMFKQKLDFVNYSFSTTCTSVIYTKSTNNAISGAVSYGSLHFATNTLKRQYVTVNGGWGYWSNWSSCSKTCDTGSMSRSRSCNNPYPAYGGSYCSGYSSESANCNTKSCPGKAILHINVCFFFFFLLLVCPWIIKSCECCVTCGDAAITIKRRAVYLDSNLIGTH